MQRRQQKLPLRQKAHHLHKENLPLKVPHLSQQRELKLHHQQSKAFHRLKQRRQQKEKLQHQRQQRKVKV